MKAEADHAEDIGTGTVKRDGGGSERRKQKNSARQLTIKQGKRLRDPQELMNRYMASAIRPKNVTSFYQSSLDAEHDRQLLPDAYSAHDVDEPTANQYGLLATAKANWKKSRKRINTQTPVGV